MESDDRERQMLFEDNSRTAFVPCVLLSESKFERLTTRVISFRVQADENVVWFSFFFLCLQYFVGHRERLEQV